MLEPFAREDDATIDLWKKSLLASTRENAIVVLSTDGVVLAWTGAAALLFGYDEHEAVGMPLSALFVPEDVQAGLDQQERELAVTAGRSEDDRWHLRKDGSRFWGSGVMEPIRGADGAIVALGKVLRDRTDVRTQVVALQNRLAATEERDARRARNLTMVAHELRNQVSPLSNLVATLERMGSDRQIAASLRRQVDALSRLLDDVIEDDAPSRSSQTLQLEPVEVQSLVRQAADAVQGDVDRRRQHLKVTLPDTPIVIEADDQRVDQMLLNLLSNASKFTPSGGTIHLSATVEDDMTAIRVEDDGNGISADVLPRIFELFTREERGGRPDGLGVGLAVVKGIAEQHGGFVEGRSPGVGKGSVFTLRLPLVQRKVPSDGAPLRV